MKTKKCSKCGKIKPLSEFYGDGNIRKSTGKQGKRSECKACSLEVSHQWNKENKNRRRTITNYAARRRRYKVIEHYSNGTMQCACCGESIYEFLTIDHIDNNGSQHRKEIGRSDITSWIFENDFPPGFQILCWNCNCAKGIHDSCPHEAIRDNEYKPIFDPSEPMPPKKTRKPRSYEHVRRHMITFDGRTQSLFEWAKEIDIAPGTLRARLYRGWSLEDALTIPTMGVGQYRLGQK